MRIFEALDFLGCSLGARREGGGEVGVELCVDAWGDGRAWLDWRKVESGFEALAGNVSADVGAAYFFILLEVAGYTSGLRDEGGGKVDKV